MTQKQYFETLKRTFSHSVWCALSNDIWFNRKKIYAIVLNFRRLTSNSLPSCTFTTVISYYLFTNIFGLIDGSRENLKIIWKVYIELSKIWVHRWIELIELHRTQIFSELIQWTWAAFTRICSQNLIKKLQYFAIFWTIVWATENLIAPLDRARRVVQDTLVSCLDTG